jgi:hypothetical protein
MAEHFQLLIEGIIANPDQRLLMPPQPARQLWNFPEARNVQTDEFAEIFERSNLTVMQLLFWLGQKLQPDIPLYNEIVVSVIPCSIDLEPFKHAFQTLINSSDALRTVIYEEDGIPQQRVLERLDYLMECIDVSKTTDPEAALEALIEHRSRILFDCERRLFDFALIKIFEERFACFINYHNILVDGRSVFLIFQRLFELYHRSLNGELSEVVSLPAFQDYVNYERELRGAPPYRKAEAYWARKLAAEPQRILYYGKQPRQGSAGSKRVPCQLDPGKMRDLQALAAREEIFIGTRDLSLLGVFATLLVAYLYRLSGESRLSVGVTYHNRNSRAFQDVIGLFMQVLPLRIEIEPHETFLSLNRKVVGELLDGFKHALYCVRSPSQHKKNHAVLNYVNYPLPTFKGEPIRVEWGHSGYQNEPLAFHVHQVDHLGTLGFKLDFNLEIFGEDQRDQAVAHFGRMLDALLADLHYPLDHPALLWDETQKQRLSHLESEADFDFSIPGI